MAPFAEPVEPTGFPRPPPPLQPHGAGRCPPSAPTVERCSRYRLRTASRTCTSISPRDQPARSCSATERAAAWAPATWSRWRRSRGARASASRSSSSPTGSPGDVLPPPPHQLDGSWIAVVERLLDEELRGLPHVVGGRSSGARVACRTAGVTGAAGIVCLAFPLQPPPRSGASPAPSRLHELDAVTVPTLVVQGVRDPFGMPPAAPGRTVAEVQADHSLRTDLEAVATAVRDWLPGVVAQALLRR